MTPDELRQSIARDQGWSLCRCGHYISMCADCRSHYEANRERYAAYWAWYLGTGQLLGHAAFPSFRDEAADAAEADNLAFFEAGR
jgi:hypothetical protein